MLKSGNNQNTPNTKDTFLIDKIFSFQKNGIQVNFIW